MELFITVEKPVTRAEKTVVWYGTGTKQADYTVIHRFPVNPDGIQDCTDAIQSAINRAKGLRAISLPTGEFSITKPLILGSI